MCYNSFQAYGTMMTGNNMKIAKSITNKEPKSIAFYSAVTLSYFFGCFIAKLVPPKKNLPGWRLPYLRMALCPFVFVLFALCELIRGLTGSRWCLLLFTTALGVVNTACQEMDGVLCQFVTGHLGKLAEGSAQLLRDGRKSFSRQDTERMIVSAAVYFWMLAGVLVMELIYFLIEDVAIRGAADPPGTWLIFGTLFGILLWEHDKQLSLLWSLGRLAKGVDDALHPQSIPTPTLLSLQSLGELTVTPWPGYT